MGRLPKTVLVALVLSLVSCTADAGPSDNEPVTDPPTSSTTRAATSTTSSVAPSTTTSTTAASQPQRVELTLLEPTDIGDRQLTWSKADVSFDRNHDVILFELGDQLMAAEWSSHAGLQMYSSADALIWSKPTSVDVPAGHHPATWIGYDPVWLRGGAHGAAMVIETPGDGPQSYQTFTTRDSITWTAAAPFDAGIELTSIAVSDDLFLVIAHDGAVKASLDGVTWTDVEGRTAPGWTETVVTAVEDRFFLLGSTGAAYVEADFSVTPMPRPRLDPVYLMATAWEDGPLVVTAMWDRSVVAPTSDGWSELPVPVLQIPVERGSGEFWSVQTISGGPAGVALAAYWPGEAFDFWGNGFASIGISVGDADGYVFGHDVLVYGQRGQIDFGFEFAFDEAGTLTIRDSDSNVELATVTCDEMRADARQTDWLVGGTIEWPMEIVAWSPDGTSWLEQSVAAIWSADAWVQQIMGFGDSFVALVAPNGEQPIPDPPNCPLGLYPKALPYEVWLGTPD